MAEVHIIGEIAGAHGFGDQALFAKYSFKAGSCWRALEGLTEGQTQLTNRWFGLKRDDDDDKREAWSSCHPWSHPIDVHYACKALQGWPRLELEVWGVDWLGKCNISAYGYLSVPMRPGEHHLECHTWRPVGDLRRRLIDYITGQRIHLAEPSDIVGAGLHRHIIQSESMGTIMVKLTIILKEFQEFGVDV